VAWAGSVQFQASFWFPVAAATGDIHTAASIRNLNIERRGSESIDILIFETCRRFSLDAQETAYNRDIPTIFDVRGRNTRKAFDIFGDLSHFFDEPVWGRRDTLPGCLEVDLHALFGKQA
jgi:hypothetical protein